jgi:hypothetical protein
MADQVVCQNRPEIQVDVFQMEIPVVTLWRQLEPARQKQLAQWLAELIRRIRESPCQKGSADEGQ